MTDALEFISQTCLKDDRVLDVGGGSGHLLNSIITETNIKQAYNCEFIPQAFKKQVNETITLVGGDALALPFKDNVFDYVVIQNVLHHLVDRTRKQSIKLASRAISELKRVAKDGGCIIILEQYNFHKIFASIVFYGTLLLSIFNSAFEWLGWHPKAIVSFLTPTEIKKLATTEEHKNKVNIIEEALFGLITSKSYRYTLLMADIGFMLLILRIHKHKAIK